MLRMAEKNKNSGSRYITLLGDPIHRGPVASFVTAPDFQVAGLTAAFVAVAGKVAGLSEQEILASTAACFGWNINDIIFFRLVLDRVAVKHIVPNNDSLFVQKETLETLCIDTQPDLQQKAESFFKYRPGILTSRFAYGAICLISTAFSIADLSILRDTSEFTRIINGFRRFNKLAKGEWAIVTMPPPEAVHKPAEDEKADLKPAYIPS